MKYIIFLVVISSIVSCTKEETTNYYAYLKNKTTHKVEIRPYSGGVIMSTNIITLFPDDSLQIANGVDRGLVNNGGFNSPYFSGADSARVIFDDIFPITHYFKPAVVLAPKYYLPSSTRNLSNKNSYFYSSRDISKYKRESIYNFEFTEQDYLDAQ
jgi:hypothetical protein